MTLLAISALPAAGRLDLAQVLVGAGLMAVATVVGICLAGSRHGRRETWFATAGGALLVIAGLHLLPDAWTAAHAARLPPLLVPLLALASFTLTGSIARRGCQCAHDEQQASGLASAIALAGHRFLEGAALALAASVTVTAALTVHALAEGLAVGALLAARPRRQKAVWVGVMCTAPVIGVVVTAVASLPRAAAPLFFALAAGVLAHAAVTSIKAAAVPAPARRLATARVATAMLLAATVTAVAVHAAG